jgi:hypothetical protein
LDAGRGERRGKEETKGRWRFAFGRAVAEGRREGGKGGKGGKREERKMRPEKWREIDKDM